LKYNLFFATKNEIIYFALRFPYYCKNLTTKVMRIKQNILFLTLFFALFYACKTKKHTQIPERSKTPVDMLDKDPVTDSEIINYLMALTNLQLNSSDNLHLYEIIVDWLGAPHKLGGTDKKGIDCSAFVKIVYHQVYGYDLNRSSYEMLKDVRNINRRHLSEGDLVFFKTSKNRVSHVGIYLKNDKFVHVSSSRGVIISDLNEDYWRRTFHSAGRVKK